MSGDLSRLGRAHALCAPTERPDWKAWFGDHGGKRDGGPDDPRLALILVDVQSVTYLKVDKPQPPVLFEVAKAMVTGTPPKIGAQRELGAEEFDQARSGLS